MSDKMNPASDIDRFWNRFGNPPDFHGKRILEVGCGKGGLSIAMAQAGAAAVVGCDISPAQITAARSTLDSDHPEIAGRVSFETQTVAEIDRRPFDLIVSKDSFEHILDVPGTLAAIHARLAPAGVVYIGFSPLYHSPYGDHDRRWTAFRAWGPAGRLLAAMPWGHLLLEKQIIRRHRLLSERRIESMKDLNLNMMSVSQFRDNIRAAGFEARYFAANRGGNPLGRPLSLLRRIPGLEKYCTYNVYCELTLVGSDLEAG